MSPGTHAPAPQPDPLQEPVGLSAVLEDILDSPIPPNHEPFTLLADHTISDGVVSMQTY